MLQRPFRDHHLLALLDQYDVQSLPLDLIVADYFRAHKALGSKDRKYMAESLYGMVRWRGLLDHLIGPPLNWERRLELYKDFNPSDYRDRHDIPPHIRYSCPAPLFNLLVAQYGEAEACQICWVANTPAPLTIRANALKGSREELLTRLQIAAKPSSQAPFGIVLDERQNLFGLPEFKEGFFEIQDEASQIVAGLIQALPGQQVMDYCAGSGGKTLAFAPAMLGKGQIFLHDVRPRILLEAKKRLHRAGIENAQTVLAEDTKLRRLKKSMDWVLVDAPCSGTGTLRRNPDMKWKFEEDDLKRLVGEQRKIFEQGLSYLKPKGHIVYATCSILKGENEDQLEHFIKVHSLELCGEPFKSLPTEGGMDGFFGAVLRRREIG